MESRDEFEVYFEGSHLHVGLGGRDTSSLSVDGDAVRRGRNTVKKTDGQGQKCVWPGRRELKGLIGSIKWSANP